MARSIYDGGKRRRHFTLSDQAFDHLTAIAHDGAISRSETLELCFLTMPGLLSLTIVPPHETV